MTRLSPPDAFVSRNSSFRVPKTYMAVPPADDTMMHLASMILLTMLGSANGAKAQVQSPVEFVGFSRNEQACAWRLHVRAPADDGAEDRYDLVHVVEIKSHKLIAVFRDSAAIARYDARGHRVAASARVLAQLHPEWSKAGSRSVWEHLKQRGGFHAEKVDFKNNLVRVVPDDDDKHLEFKEKKKVLSITSKAGAPLGYEAVARLYDGASIALGHYRAEGHDGQAAHVRMQVYFSKPGHVIAVVNTFGTDAKNARSEADFFTTPQNNPIGTTNIGSLNMIETDSQSIEALYKQMHPNGAHDYDVFIGRWF